MRLEPHPSGHIDGLYGACTVSRLILPVLFSSCRSMIVRIHAHVYLGWLEYEIGEYDRAIRYLNTAIGLITGMCAGDSEMGGPNGDMSINTLCLLREHSDGGHEYHLLKNGNG